jgi:hypothetical protein
VRQKVRRRRRTREHHAGDDRGGDGRDHRARDQDQEEDVHRSGGGGGGGDGAQRRLRPIAPSTRDTAVGGLDSDGDDASEGSRNRTPRGYGERHHHSPERSGQSMTTETTAIQTDHRAAAPREVKPVIVTQQESLKFAMSPHGALTALHGGKGGTGLPRDVLMGSETERQTAKAKQEKLVRDLEEQVREAKEVCV